MTPAQRRALVRSITHRIDALQLLEDRRVIEALAMPPRPVETEISSERLKEVLNASIGDLRESINLSLMAYLPERHHAAIGPVMVEVGTLLMVAMTRSGHDREADVELLIDTVFSHRDAIGELGELAP